eukprot:Phypoly_transcript_18494.p1 GENE.Phypoly_transcript_18494~~Phypoly_transcript_18494.p1  ORF type:complete len:180 (-),score=14.75 Phypoly_transcript_18494:79-618(-)
MLKVIFALVLLCGVCFADEHRCLTCATVKCKAPAICIEEEVECIRAPCCKVPRCIPLCGRDVCGPDEECVVDPCLIPPCPAHCEKKGCQYQEDGAETNRRDDDKDCDGCPDDPCAGVRCKYPLTCTPETVVCVRAPCCRVPKCDCGGVDCKEDETCKELLCARSPCGRLCLPTNRTETH